MATEDGEALNPKTPRQRSPNYPAVGLSVALDRVVLLYKANQEIGAPLEAALRHIGFSGEHGRSMMVLSALKKFGLIENVDGMIVPTRRAVEILALPKGDARYRSAVQEAALSPDIYRELWERFAKTGLPLDDHAMVSHLVASKGFRPAAAAGLLKNFRQTIQFAGLSKPIERAEGADQASVKVGDYVQWESQGVLRFAEPRRVRVVYEDPQFALVEGSDTGLPMNELTVVAAPAGSPFESPPPMPFSPLTTGEEQQLLVASPVGNRVHQDVFSLPEGAAIVQWPAMSLESFQEFSSWLDLLKRKIGRALVTNTTP